MIKPHTLPSWPVLRDWSDLTPFGLQYLTGERCRYGMRMLCDLNEDGTKLVSEFLGLPQALHICCFEGPWNREVNGKPSVASILLPTGCFVQLAVFCLFSQGAPKVWLVEGAVMVPEPEHCAVYDEAWSHPDLWCQDDDKRRAAKAAIPYPYDHVQQFAPTCPEAPKAAGGTNLHLMTSR